MSSYKVAFGSKAISVSITTEKFMAIISIALICLGVVNPIFSIAAFFINAVYFIFAKSDAIYYQMFFLIPFANIFKYSRSSTSMFTYLTILIVTVMFLKRKKCDLNFIIVFFIFAGYVAVGGNLNYTMILKQISIPLVIYCFFHYCNISFKKLICYLSVSTILSGFFALFRDSIPNLSRYIGKIKAWELESNNYRFTGLYTDPNYFSVVVIICIIGILVLNMNKQINPLSLIMLAPLVLFGSYTISKSFLLMLGVIAVYYIFLFFKSKRYFWGILFSLITAFFAVMIFSGKIQMFSGVMDRFYDSIESGDITTNRTNIWGRYIDYFGENIKCLFFGDGIGVGYLYGGAAAHNSFIDFIYYYGIIGTILFISSCIIATGRKPISGRRIPENYFMWICFLIMQFFLSYVNTFDFSFIICIMVLAYRQRFTNTIE
ncbi:MAG: O-antigen ligase family protein [Clostridia bacterium]|nr:O-antigen ligase family protein [Clostridia bacterium]